MVELAFAEKTGQAARKPLQFVYKELMSEPPAKVARIMPEVNEKFVANGEHLAGLNGECETVKTNKHAESNGMVNGDEKIENGHSHHETNGHANTNLEKECTGDSEKYGDGSELLVKRLSEDAKMPHRGSLHAAGKLGIFKKYL